MSGDDHKVAANPGAHPGYVEGDTGVFWDDAYLPIAASFNPYMVVRNLTTALETSKSLFGFLKLWYYCEEQPVMDDKLEDFENARFFIESGVSGGDDPSWTSARAKSMIADVLFWALDMRTFRTHAEPANLIIVSNEISDKPELVDVLKGLQQQNFNIILVQSDEKDSVDIPTENFEWVWRCVLEGSSSSQEALAKKEEVVAKDETAHAKKAAEEAAKKDA